MERHRALRHIAGHVGRGRNYRVRAERQRQKLDLLSVRCERSVKRPPRAAIDEARHVISRREAQRQHVAVQIVALDGRVEL